MPMLRQYRNHMAQFVKVSKQIRNISDPGADMEQLMNDISLLCDEAELVKMA